MRIINGKTICDYLWNHAPNKVVEILGFVPEGLYDKPAKAGDDFKVKQSNDNTWSEDE